jgi:hypothetical protein
LYCGAADKGPWTIGTAVMPPRAIWLTRWLTRKIPDDRRVGLAIL